MWQTLLKYCQVIYYVVIQQSPEPTLISSQINLIVLKMPSWINSTSVKYCVKYCVTIKSIEFNIKYIFWKVSCKLGGIGHELSNKQTSSLFAMMLYNLRESIILHMCWRSKLLNLTYAKGHKWIGTIKCFQWYNYKVVV